MRFITFGSVSLSLLFMGLLSCQPASNVTSSNTSTCDISFTILGTGQDGGAPQIGNHSDPGWTAPVAKLLAASGALIDHSSGARYLFEATPDIREQLYRLDQIHNQTSDQSKTTVNIDAPLGLSGVFLTHAHIGHYAGLMMFGHEAAGTKNLPVYAMPRMREYLETNGPWSQLVDFSNIELKSLEMSQKTSLSSEISVTPYRVPHRDEFSETVGFVIETPTKSLLFLPDIDDWDEWAADYGIKIEEMIRSIDYAYLDATFYDDNELPGRDMSRIPHPRMLDSAKRFATLPADEKAKIRFFHMNHTNAARFPKSEQAKTIKAMGFHIAQQGEVVCLSYPSE
jgi:pyrroloquinoline quinone biosynthesis protein B